MEKCRGPSTAHTEMQGKKQNHQDTRTAVIDTISCR